MSYDVRVYAKTWLGSDFGERSMCDTFTISPDEVESLSDCEEWVRESILADKDGDSLKAISRCSGEGDILYLLHLYRDGELVLFDNVWLSSVAFDMVREQTE